MTLHTINKTPAESSALQSCIDTLSDGDALLLVENGVYGALPGYAALFTRLPGQVKCYVLAADTDARGLKDLNQDFTTIDYDRFVELSCEYSKVVSWY